MNQLFHPPPSERIRGNEGERVLAILGKAGITPDELEANLDVLVRAVSKGRSEEQERTKARKERELLNEGHKTLAPYIVKVEGGFPGPYRVREWLKKNPPLGTGSPLTKNFLQQMGSDRKIRIFPKYPDPSDIPDPQEGDDSGEALTMQPGNPSPNAYLILNNGEIIEVHIHNASPRESVSIFL